MLTQVVHTAVCHVAVSSVLSVCVDSGSTNSSVSCCCVISVKCVLTQVVHTAVCHVAVSSVLSVC